MKRLITIILLSLTGIAGLKAQAVVHDPVHMGANIAGFSESVGQAIETTGNLLSLLGLAEDQLEKLEKSIEYVEKVTLAARTLQSVGNSIKEMEEVIMGINASIKTLRHAVSQKNIGIKEATNILNAYSGVMNNLTNIGNAIISITTSGMEQMDQWQRTEELNELSRRISVAKLRVNSLNNGINNRLAWRSRAKARLDSARNPLSAMASEATASDPNFLSVKNLENDIPITVLPQVTFEEINRAFEEMAALTPTGAGGSGSKGGWGMNNRDNGVKTSAQAKAAISKEAKGMAGLFWAISAVVGLLGAFQVYRKYQFGGEDLTKSIAMWGGTTILLFIIGLILKA